MRDGAARFLSHVHTGLYLLTGGAIGRRLVNNDMLLLTSRGRYTGTPHTVPLLYLRDVSSLIVFASWGGRPNHPEWYLNLCAQPDAHVRIDGRRLPVTATTLGGDERAHWWDAAVEAYDGYRTYQSRTDREIPVVRLQPR